jgi:hypothetical protein
VGTTLRELRRLVGDTTGDVLVCVATHASEQLSTFRDTTHLANRENRSSTLIHRIIYFSYGTADNLGHEAAITDYTGGTTRTLVFTPDAPALPQVDDEAELWSQSERVQSIGHLNRLINYAIAQVADMAEAEEFASDATYDQRTQTLSIPSTWAEYGGAQWLAPDGTIKAVPSKYQNVIPGQRLVRIWGAPSYRANRRTMQLFGYPRSSALTTEDSETNVDAEWIVESVSQIITLAASPSGSDGGAGGERRANFWAARSALYRRNIAAPRRGLRIPLPPT